jgi:outer membrane protein assembly factor BamB
VQKSLTCCAAVLLAYAGLAHAQGTPAKVPAIEAFGKGVQIYTCKASNGSYAWSLKAPDASLADAKGNVIGKHFAGPSWQANDGSVVVGEPLNVSPSPDAGAVAWLVLHAKSHTGNGAMATVQYIVRTRTEGGVAPVSGCDAAHAGTEMRVPYSAVYLFFRG